VQSRQAVSQRDSQAGSQDILIAIKNTVLIYSSNAMVAKEKATERGRRKRSGRKCEHNLTMFSNIIYRA